MIQNTKSIVCLNVWTTWMYGQLECMDDLNVWTTWMYGRLECMDDLNVWTTWMYGRLECMDDLNFGLTWMSPLPKCLTFHNSWSDRYLPTYIYVDINHFESIGELPLLQSVFSNLWLACHLVAVIVSAIRGYFMSKQMPAKKFFPQGENSLPLSKPFSNMNRITKSTKIWKQIWEYFLRADEMAEQTASQVVPIC